VTYASDILSKEDHQIGYFIAFDGIASTISTHASIAGSLPVMLKPPGGSGESLDRARSLIMPGGFSVEIAATDDTNLYFARRGGLEGTLKNSRAATILDIEFNEGTIYPAESVIYIEKESIVLGVISGGVYTGCTRAYKGSEGQDHGAGMIASDRPRYWMGRRAKLYAVDLETGHFEVIRTGILSSSPRFTNGVYQLQFVDMQREFNRKVYVGWKSQTAQIIEANSTPTLRDFTIDVPDIREFSLTADSHVKITFGNSFAIIKIRPVQISAANSTVIFNLKNTANPQGDLIGWGGEVEDKDDVCSFFGDIPESPEVSVRTVGYVRGSPAICALMIMTSRNGNLKNGGYDLLPGSTVAASLTTGDMTPKRIGAGLPQDWIDFASWEDYAEGESIVMILDEPTTVLDFLEETVWLIGGYVYINSDGKIAFKKYEPAVPQGALATYGENDVIQMARTIVDDESEIIAAGTIECDWNYALQKYMRTIEAHWTTTFQTYGEGRSQIKFASKSVRTIDSNAQTNLSSSVVNELQLVTMMDRIYSRTKDGVEKIKISVPWKYSNLFKAGYVFKYTDSTLPSAGTVGFSSKQFEVVGVNANYEAGRVEIEAEEQPRGWLVAPAGYVDSYDGGTLIVTFDLTGEESLLFDADPGLDFIEDCKVITITFAAAPTVAPASGDIIVLDASVNTGNTNSIGADVEDHLFCSSSATHPPVILGGSVVGNKWS